MKKKLKVKVTDETHLAVLSKNIGIELHSNLKELNLDTMDIESSLMKEMF